MSPIRTDDFAVTDILKKERICTFFQPVVSLKTGQIFAYEALVRGIRDDADSFIAPDELFSRAERETVSLEFDRLCRKKALENFQGFHHTSAALMFMNINTSVIDSSENEKPHISTISQQMGFDPRHIGLEVIESRAASSDGLVEFASHYRDTGFLIIIDDFGCEHSNLDRLIQIHPDIIKVDRSIVSGIESDPYRQSILKSIHSLAEMTGALCLAEGVETVDEICACHRLGVDLYQGYIIAMPSPDLPRLERETLARISEIRASIRQTTISSFSSRRRLTGDVTRLADWLVRQISPRDIDGMIPVFEEFIAMNSEIECIYLLDAAGRQITETISSPLVDQIRKPGFFAPAGKGADHSFKPFYTCFEALRVQQYLTDVYLSLASGNLCRTFSVMLRRPDATAFILCIDFLEEIVRGPARAALP